MQPSNNTAPVQVRNVDRPGIFIVVLLKKVIDEMSSADQPAANRSSTEKSNPDVVLRTRRGKCPMPRARRTGPLSPPKRHLKIEQLQKAIQIPRRASFVRHVGFDAHGIDNRIGYLRHSLPPRARRCDS